MKPTCESCQKEFERRQDNQRFCGQKCCAAFFANERRIAVQAYRAQQRGMTYHSRAQLDDSAPGGRFAVASSPRRITGAGPWPSPRPTAAAANDPCGIEPVIEGDNDVLGVALGGGGGQPDA